MKHTYKKGDYVTDNNGSIARVESVRDNLVISTKFYPTMEALKEANKNAVSYHSSFNSNAEHVIGIKPMTAKGDKNGANDRDKGTKDKDTTNAKKDAETGAQATTDDVTGDTTDANDVSDDMPEVDEDGFVEVTAELLEKMPELETLAGYKIGDKFKPEPTK